MEFLASWKEIPESNEFQSPINVSITSDEAEKKLGVNNIFMIARRTVSDHELIYLSAQLVNNMKILAELKIAPNGNHMVSGV